MGHVDFTSHKVDLPARAEAVFLFFSDMNNYQKMMPEQIINWRSTTEECEFDIKGMAHIGLFKSGEIPGKSVSISSKPDNPLELQLQANVEPSGDNSSVAWIGLSAHLSPILQMMASAPLQNLVNMMAEKLKGVLSAEC